ncbi:MAG: DUF898 family protein [Ferrovibrio sp.]
MTTFRELPPLRVGPGDSVESAEVTAPTGAASGMPDSVGMVYVSRPGLLRLLLKNFGLSILTLGVYRFWARTALRRYFWSAITIGGEPLEYIGRGSELFVGFLVVMAIFIPLTIAYSAMQTLLLGNPFADTGMIIAYMLGITLLIAAASYRARRYRLSRTLWRGIRANQGGSTWHYVGRYFLWMLAGIFTLGLTVPAACANLARYRMQHSHWGNWQGSFDGRAKDLALPWLLVLAFPLIAILFAVPVLADIPILIGRGDPLSMLFPAYTVRYGAVMFGLLIGSMVLAMLLTPLFYIYFQLRWLAWNIAGSRIGPLQFQPIFRPGRLLLRIVLGYLLLLIGIVVFVFGAMLLIGVTSTFFKTPEESQFFFGIIVMLPAYLLLYLGSSLLSTLLITVPVLRRIANGIVITGLAAIASVRQSDAAVDASGEGLADSFDVGFT